MNQQNGAAGIIDLPPDADLRVDVQVVQDNDVLRQGIVPQGEGGAQRRRRGRARRRHARNVAMDIIEEDASEDEPEV